MFYHKILLLFTKTVQNHYKRVIILKKYSALGFILVTIHLWAALGTKWITLNNSSYSSDISVKNGTFLSFSKNLLNSLSLLNTFVAKGGQEFKTPFKYHALMQRLGRFVGNLEDKGQELSKLPSLTKKGQKAII